MSKLFPQAFLACVLILGCGEANQDVIENTADAGSDDDDDDDVGSPVESLQPACTTGSPTANHESAGKLLWSYRHDLQANAGPTLDKDANVYIHGQHSLLSDSDAPTFVALDSRGALRWSAETNPSESNLSSIPGPIIADDEIWVPTTVSLTENTGMVHRFTAAGEVLAPIPLPGKPWAYSAYHDGVLYVPSNTLIAVDRDGLVWDEPFDFRDDGRAGTNVVVSPDGIIYVGARGDDTSLYAINTQGRKLFSQNMGQNMTNKLSIDRNGSVFFGMKSRGLSDPAYITSIDNEGYENWLFDEGPGQWDSVHIDRNGIIYAGGLIYANAATAEALYGLFAFSHTGASSPEVLWFTTLDNLKLQGTFVISAGGTLVFTDTCKTLWAINASTGELEWTFDVPESGLGPAALCAKPMSSPTLGSDGTLYFTAGGSIGPGTLYAVSGDGTGISCDAHWAGDQGGLGMTGSAGP